MYVRILEKKLTQDQMKSTPSNQPLKVAIAQIDPVVGAFEANVKKIKEAYRQACTEGARILVTPEMGICGYPLHDLIERPEVFERNERALEDVMSVTRGTSCALIVGHVSQNPGSFGRAAQNTVTVLEGGARVFRQAKMLLPTYDVFDEARYFEPATEVKPWICDGHRIALTICEDLWARDPSFGRHLYARDPVKLYKDQGVDLVLSISSSPYEWAKRERRESLHSEVAKDLGVPLIYINQVGATDEILFDGGSFAVDHEGKFCGRLPFFKTSFGVLAILQGQIDWPKSGLTGAKAEIGAYKIEREDESVPEIESLCRGLIVGIREYFARTVFKTAILGLSGGIDSAVVAVLAVKALGAQNVLGVAMPSQYSSAHSMTDAEALARNLKMRFEVRSIKFQYSVVSMELSGARGPMAPIALENLQSRLRGAILMTLANHLNALVLTTGNKSELATGYCTLYGDMVGALAPIGDLLKTRVYELAHHINEKFGVLIPPSSITKAPSAELRPNQTDQDTLPPYDQLDVLLAEYIEKRTSVAELENRLSFGKEKWVREILHKLELNEYKRRQAAPVLKTSPKAFGIGRRIPVAKVWEQ